MTTEKDNIKQTEETTVSEESVQAEVKDSSADLVEQAVQQEEAKAESKEQPTYLTADDLNKVLDERKAVFDNAQGRAQQYTNQKV